MPALLLHKPDELAVFLLAPLTLPEQQQGLLMINMALLCTGDRARKGMVTKKAPAFAITQAWLHGVCQVIAAHVYGLKVSALRCVLVLYAELVTRMDSCSWRADMCRERIISTPALVNRMPAFAWENAIDIGYPI